MVCSSSPCSDFGTSKPVCRAEQCPKVVMLYELYNYQCLAMGWGHLSEEEMDRAPLMPFLPAGSSSETNHSAAFTAVLCTMRARGGVAEQKVIMANQVSVVLLLCAMDHFFSLWGFKWKKWLRWKKPESLLYVSLDTSSKWQHNKIVFLVKILVKFSFVFCLKRGAGGVIINVT